VASKGFDAIIQHIKESNEQFRAFVNLDSLVKLDDNHAI
jgi:hypothetical protein